VVEPHLQFLVRDGSVNPREVKRYLNAYTITTKINADLDQNAVLSVLLLDFRDDWEEVESALLLNGGVFVDALRRLHMGDATAFDDIGLELRLPDDFVTYTRGGQPGNGLTLINDIERYFRNVGTARLTRDPELLQLLPQVGAVRRDMATLKDDPARRPQVLGAAHKAMSMLRSRLPQGSATPSPLAALILEDVEQFTAVARNLEQITKDPNAPASAEIERLAEQLEELARRISQRLLALYRAAGNSAAGAATQSATSVA
jgi:hypothetical protein